MGKKQCFKYFSKRSALSRDVVSIENITINTTIKSFKKSLQDDSKGIVKVVEGTGKHFNFSVTHPVQGSEGALTEES